MSLVTITGAQGRTVLLDLQGLPLPHPQTLDDGRPAAVQS